MLVQSRLLPSLLRAPILALALATSACQPSLPSPGPDDATAASPATEPHVVLVPDAPLDSAPRVLRIRVVPQPGASADASRLLLVRGHVGKAHVRQVEDGEISAALSERILPALAWPSEGDSAILAPLGALDPGGTYGVLSADPPLGIDIHVATSDPVPLLPRVWPPPDAPEKGTFAIFCGDVPMSFAPTSISLDPGSVLAALSPGLTSRIAPNCLRIDAPPAGEPLVEGASPSDSAAPDSPVSGSPVADGTLVLPPPLVSLHGTGDLRLDPLPISRAETPSPVPLPPLDCEAGEIPFGPACARVADDRLFLTTPDVPLFWSVRSAATGPSIRVTGASEPWALTGLRPSETASFQITTIDVAGAPRTATAAVITSAPMPHVVISEVLANPLGAEPDQEWVELFNDGLAAADLGGYVLADIGGETVLPAAVLPPGGFALVVNDAFVEDDELDPVPPTGTLLLRVAKLGKGGLKNDGEPLKLLTPDGQVVSRFPASPKPKAGASVARIDASSPSNDAASFKVGPPTPGVPN